MIDWAQARQLEKDVGKEEMAEVVELFLAEVDEAMEKLQSAYDEMPAEDRSTSFHFLKGCASNLGFKSFGDQCSLGEEVTKTGGIPNFQISDLATTYAASKKQFMDDYDAKLG